MSLCYLSVLIRNYSAVMYPYCHMSLTSGFAAQHSCRRTYILPGILLSFFSFFLFSSATRGACWMELNQNWPHAWK